MASTLNFSNAASSDMTNKVHDYEVTPLQTHGATGNKETEYTNPLFTKYFGYYNSSPDLKSAIISKVTWICGKGWEADNDTTYILDHIKGWGKDSFDDILFNMCILSRINGDSFAEIIRDEKTGILVNLKVLDPSSIKIIVDEYGIIKRYEQTNKVPNGKNIKFEPKEIFHLSNNRVADQIHGLSDIQGMEDTLKAEAESFDDMKKIMHHQAKPFILWKLGTDDPTKIAAIIAKIDNCRNLGEDMFIPDDDDAISYEIVKLDPSAVIFNWRDDIRKKFYRTIGLPELLPDSSGATESGGKIGYLCFEQIVERDQRYLETQIWNQLHLKINLIPPTSLTENLQNDNAKDGTNAFQPSDMIAGVGR